MESHWRSAEIVFAAIVFFVALCLARPFQTAGLAQNTASAHIRAVQGRQEFIANCGRCHGLDGRGGEHAPNIAGDSAVQDLTDAELERVIRDGLPAKGMPAFSSIGPAGIKAVVSYLRVLQGRQATVAVRGIPVRGKELFFGSAHCSDCHMVQGKGGFLGPDLSRYALTHSEKDIRQAIVEPNKDLSPADGTVTAVTRDGQAWTGIARNEDNFSLQLQTTDGAFHLLMKSELASLRREPRSFMPSDYSAKLSNADLDDLVSFLVKAGEPSASREIQPGSDR